VLHIIIERGEHIIPMRVLLCTADQNLLNPIGKLYTRDELDCQRRHSCSAGEFFGSFLSVFVFLCVIQMRSCVLIFLWPDDEQLRDDKSERESRQLYGRKTTFSLACAPSALNFVSGCFQLRRARRGCRFFGRIKERCLYPNLWARFIQFEEV
jgi:hypothetical protein